MTDKTIQERLRELAYLYDYDKYKRHITLREAADLIDRLTAPVTEEQVERVARAIFEGMEAQDCVGEYPEGNRTTWVDGHFNFMNIARAAIAAMPSAEAIRRDEREAVFQCPNKDRGLEQCKALHTTTTTGHPLTWCQLSSCPLMPRAQNTIRARNGDRNAHD